MKIVLRTGASLRSSINGGFDRRESMLVIHHIESANQQDACS